MKTLFFYSKIKSVNGFIGTEVDDWLDMDKNRMTFNIDQRTVNEGDVVELTWQCDGAESVTLTIDNGYRGLAEPVVATDADKMA